MQSIWSPRLLLKRSRLAQHVLAKPRMAEFREVLRAELQSTRDLFNFNRHDPLADMYRSERCATALNAGSSLVASGLSVIYPSIALAMPILPYLGYKAARSFRPAALVVGSALGLGGGVLIDHYRHTEAPQAQPPTIMPDKPHAPIREHKGQIVMLAQAYQARHTPAA